MNNELNLQEKIAAITKEMGAIPKTKKENSTVKYAFRGIDDVMNKLSPLLALHSVSLQSKILNHSLTSEWGKDKFGNDRKSCTAMVHYALIFSSGDESEVFESIAMSEDFSDKAMTQAESMAYKYAILRKFCIMTEDMPDGDGRDPEKLTKQESEDVKKKFENKLNNISPAMVIPEVPTQAEKDVLMKMVANIPQDDRGKAAASINAIKDYKTYNQIEARLKELQPKLLTK